MSIQALLTRVAALSARSLLVGRVAWGRGEGSESLPTGFRFKLGSLDRRDCPRRR